MDITFYHEALNDFIPQIEDPLIQVKTVTTQKRLSLAAFCSQIFLFRLLPTTTSNGQ